MPKVKVPRKNISLDMTAMCDMAFLLLTFFMLTTKFKAPEAAVVDIPSSVSKIDKKDKNIMTISVDRKGGVFFDIDQKDVRADLLDQIAEKYSISFTEQEKSAFSSMTSFGVPVNKLKGILNATVDKRAELEQTGIPCDSANNELRDWIRLSRQANPEAEIAIKGDRGSDYEVMDKVIATLQEENINKFSLITSLESKPN
ncbi:MAG: ExbD/TolR family protein [Cytophagaceae bacterium]